MTHQGRKSDSPGHIRPDDRPTRYPHSGFSGLGIAPGLLNAIDRLKFSEPTPIQRQAIPIGIEGKDLIAIAQTGTGKTLAFAVPMIQRLAQIKGRGLVITPTRELALQIDEALNDVGRSLGLRTAVLIGGAPMAPQRRSLERQPRVIVATPGRLLDHLEHRIVSLADVQILVLDEADRMLDMGFAPQINKILAALPKKRQMMLFSATMPTEILALARREMQVPIHVEVAPSGTAPDKVVQEMFFVEKGAKTQLLTVILGQCLGPVLIFTRTKHGARKLAREVKSMGHSAAEIHSNRSMPQRREALDGFKSGKYRALVATDIASRGIDVSGIELVVNYDLPSNSEDYVHRIGRTARAGQSGRAISFATLAQKKDIRDIERLIRTDIPIVKLPPLPLQRRKDFAPEPSRADEPPQRPFSDQRPLKKPTSPRRSSSRAGFRWRKRR
ncbi:MAG TPA: DEAD/DEAH box helicase [Candidatus Deferrimicrobium sp.]|nr:DEAD/DEAH box helicase [Candidatus Deferrimicrobium sp.]